MEEGKEDNITRDIVVYVGAIVAGIEGTLMLIIIFPALRREAAELSIPLPMLISWLITYYFTRNLKKSLLSGIIAGLIEILIFVILFLRAFTRW